MNGDLIHLWTEDGEAGGSPPAADLAARHLSVRTVTEDVPGAAWQRHFADLWPGYRRWFLSEGEGARMSLAASAGRLRSAMPELYPVYERLCALAAETGRGEIAGRFLSLYRPPPYLAGCSQVLWTRPHAEGGEPVLMRNYDYDPGLWEAAIWRSSWTGRRVLAISDCLWGALEGMNDRGLAVGLSFGGRRIVGDGFGIPLIVRYLLETCDDAKAARWALGAAPSHMAYNLAVVDATGDSFVAYLTPGERIEVTDERVVTNHQAVRDWEEYTRFTQTLERRDRLEEAVERVSAGRPLLDAFLEPPVFTDRYDHSFGTLYTAVWRPASGSVDLVWRDQARSVSLHGGLDEEWSVVLGPTGS